MAAPMGRPVAAMPEKEEEDEKEQEAGFGSWEPSGAAPYGNFPQYSRFHPPEARIGLLPAGLLQQLFPAARAAATAPAPLLLGLDVGCNSGELSVALYRHLTAPPAAGTGPGPDLRLLCCDIDAGLVERARRACPFPGALSFVRLDIMDPAAREPALASFLARHGRRAFDLGFCMSLTMWVHLRHGDAGLRALLARLASLCRFLLVEPQPWRCYRAAARRLRRLGRRDFDHFGSLAIRGDMAQSVARILTGELGMELHSCFGTTPWDRSLLLFRATS
ncbi:RNA 5'-monophosphate methyltransferase [Tachyglossus aculeatus]|uniref:RNA 5'-monophosphate methyltransferase n=1 Tax=Tachyglossus aculeatus TaxID=9261 RepID=UPI0018F765A9|nr:RNA 5'-monophosphate methyltransferase [Tachyglossus aculeatus]